MPKKGVPDRWEDFTPLGSLIPGTRIFGFKVPLKKSLCHKLQNRRKAFTVQDLKNQISNLGLVIDLTNTSRYYDPKEIIKDDIKYIKIASEGRGKLPAKEKIKFFYSSIDRFLAQNENNDKIIGVHCTHGLNRTGFFICKYLIDRQGWKAEDAIQKFEDSRGHKIERETYVNELKNPNSNPETHLNNHTFFNSYVPSSSRNRFELNHSRQYNTPNLRTDDMRRQNWTERKSSRSNDTSLNAQRSDIYRTHIPNAHISSYVSMPYQATNFEFRPERARIFSNFANPNMYWQCNNLNYRRNTNFYNDDERGIRNFGNNQAFSNHFVDTYQPNNGSKMNFVDEKGRNKFRSKRQF